MFVFLITGFSAVFQIGKERRRIPPFIFFSYTETGGRIPWMDFGVPGFRHGVCYFAGNLVAVGSSNNVVLDCFGFFFDIAEETVIR